jgi:type IV pilus biogenesis protein CpaD/CtpE
MRLRSLFWTVGLLATLGLFACAPAATTPSVSIVAPTETPIVAANASPATELVIPTFTSVPVLAVATSRGPNLEATDPTTVSLASGQLQLVEFFRFT